MEEEKRQLDTEKIIKLTDLKLETFKNFTIQHPKLNKAASELEDAIRETGGARLIFVMGPSGVGKTTLFKKMTELLTQWYRDPNDPGQIPVISVEAPAPSSGQFSWRRLYVECLKELKDPITLRVYDRPDLFGNIVLSKEKRSEFDLRAAFETALKYRKTKIVMIDEAHHIGIVSSGRRMKDQTEFLKSTGNMTDITYVLYGTYDLFQLCNLNGQLANRETIVHFSRYDAREKIDREIFQNILFTFQNNIPTEIKPNLEDEWQFLYERSIGCVGACKLWLNKAISKALNEHACTVTLDHLKATAHSVEQCLQQTRDALHGEMRFVESQEQVDNLRNLLGIEENDGRNFNVEEEKKTIRNKRPGQRDPKRDKVG